MKTEIHDGDSVQGGDVMGTKKIDVSQGRALDVAAASFNPGYKLDSTFKAGYIDEACLTRGYCDYGVAVGEDSPIANKKQNG
jgi:hypothetical protein